VRAIPHETRGMRDFDPKLVVNGTRVSDAGTGMRVLVVARDRRFRAAASTLLAGRGCAVSLHAEVEEVADRAARERPQVVVIDATTLPGAAARTAARLEAMRPPVGVVTVSDEPHEPHGQPAALPLPKWGSFEALFAAVQRASRGGDDA
jgi:DNA-binding NarL/FixJ family response regulator